MLATLIVPAIEASPRQSQEIKRSDLVEAAADVHQLEMTYLEAHGGARRINLPRAMRNE
jgi:hypothetical protein